MFGCLGHLEDEVLHKYLGFANLAQNVEELEEHKVRAEKYLQYLEEKRQCKSVLTTLKIYHSIVYMLYF